MLGQSQKVWLPTNITLTNRYRQRELYTKSNTWENNPPTHTDRSGVGDTLSGPTLGPCLALFQKVDIKGKKKNLKKTHKRKKRKNIKRKTKKEKIN